MKPLHSRVEEAIEYLKAHCNQYTNGFCQTRKCLREGAEEFGMDIKHALPRCVAMRTIETINELYVQGQ